MSYSERDMMTTQEIPAWQPEEQVVDAYVDGHAQLAQHRYKTSTNDLHQTQELEAVR